MERNNMRIKSEIEELNAKFDHLQDRFDNLRDYIKENPPSDYYWNKFEDLLAWSLKFDKNSEEYSKLLAGMVIERIKVDYPALGTLKKEGVIDDNRS